MSCTDTLTGPGGPSIERAVPTLAGHHPTAEYSSRFPPTNAVRTCQRVDEAAGDASERSDPDPVNRNRTRPAPWQ